MSERSIRRATARREAAQRRREELRRRHAGLIVGAAIGASVLGVAPAQAATLTVTSKADAASNACDDDCTLRDAIAQAADGDRIVFASTVTGSIRLTAGQLGVDDSIRIDGPGAGTLSILGADNGNETLDPEDSRIVQVTGVGNEVVLAGLTLSEGGGGGGGGGAIRVAQENQLRLVDSTVTGNLSARDGGGIEAYGADLELIRSTVSGNRGLRGGGVAAVPDQSFKYDRVSNLTVEGSTISGNTAAGDADGTSTGDGGGILSGGGLRVSRSTISGNTTAEGSGGGIAQLAIRSVDVDDATI